MQGAPKQPQGQSGVQRRAKFRILGIEGGTSGHWGGSPRGSPLGQSLVLGDGELGGGGLEKKSHLDC